MKEQKNLYIKTYGCQMNIYDSEQMANLLMPFGFKISDDLTTADMVILNTCHIREKASEKVYSEIGRLKILKEQKQLINQDLIIAVAGCVAQAEGEEIIKRAPIVDIVVGPQSFHNLPELITNLNRKKKLSIDLDFKPVRKFDSLTQTAVNQTNKISAFVTIQEGCDEFCKYCVVPYTRGAEYSRPLEEVYQEVSKLAQQGTIEIILLGQNVNAYNGIDRAAKPSNLGALIKKIANIESIKRIRYTTSHPKSMHPELIEAHGTVDKLMPFLHLPVQSGSNRILKAMNRKHTINQYLEIIENLRKVRPDIGFSSDFIVGYPGENEEDFNDTIKLVKTVKFAQCYSFKYSPRAGTPASIASNQIPEEIKNQRLAILQNLISSSQQIYNEASIGEEYEILLEKKGKYNNQLVGKSPYMQSVHLEGDSKLIGQIIKAKIKNCMSNSLGAVRI